MTIITNFLSYFTIQKAFWKNFYDTHPTPAVGRGEKCEISRYTFIKENNNTDSLVV